MTELGMTNDVGRVMATRTRPRTKGQELVISRVRSPA